ncbi:MAG TPA: hypothetical protein DCF63_17225 [Planctomycetaceae bacterium]|nr:hypothetical protein [Planctomycetaceae bacterium]
MSASRLSTFCWRLFLLPIEFLARPTLGLSKWQARNAPRLVGDSIKLSVVSDGNDAPISDLVEYSVPAQ